MEHSKFVTTLLLVISGKSIRISARVNECFHFSHLSTVYVLNPGISSSQCPGLLAF